MGGRRDVSIISPSPATSSDLKHERLFFPESVSTFLQLVVAEPTFCFSCKQFATFCQKMYEKLAQ